MQRIKYQDRSSVLVERSAAATRVLSQVFPASGHTPDADTLPIVSAGQVGDRNNILYKFQSH